jgi:beta-lactam-binding protein with PASTA domain
LQQDKDSKESQSIFVADNKLHTMPDLRGKTIKEALLILNELGVKWSISGSGVVAEQSILPGQALNKRKTCILTCSQISTTGARIY